MEIPSGCRDAHVKVDHPISAEKKIFSTENSVRPNCDDSNRVLFITTDVDLGSERTIRCRYIK
jgi:hypothetical protein